MVNEQPVVDEVIVSDYAVVQGAAHKQPNGNETRADLQNSVTVEREISKMYAKTPVPHGLDQREIERVHW